EMPPDLTRSTLGDSKVDLGGAAAWVRNTDRHQIDSTPVPANVHSSTSTNPVPAAANATPIKIVSSIQADAYPPSPPASYEAEPQAVKLSHEFNKLPFTPPSSTESSSDSDSANSYFSSSSRSVRQSSSLTGEPGEAHQLISKVRPDLLAQSRALFALRPEWEASLYAPSATSEAGERTLYCRANRSGLVESRENLVDLLEQADEIWNCSALVICLKKTDQDLEHALHSLMYVGGSILAPHARQSEEYILVGLDL
ncbi:hypothetical protein E5Q_05826, partial [Mixia osmundae IAM 14324]